MHLEGKVILKKHANFLISNNPCINISRNKSKAISKRKKGCATILEYENNTVPMLILPNGLHDRMMSS